MRKRDTYRSSTWSADAVVHEVIVTSPSIWDMTNYSVLRIVKLIMKLHRVPAFVHPGYENNFNLTEKIFVVIPLHKWRKWHITRISPNVTEVMPTFKCSLFCTIAMKSSSPLSYPTFPFLFLLFLFSKITCRLVFSVTNPFIWLGFASVCLHVAVFLISYSHPLCTPLLHKFSTVLTVLMNAAVDAKIWSKYLCNRVCIYLHLCLSPFLPLSLFLS